jgi:mannose-1-phosphate guanylyltransferase
LDAIVLVGGQGTRLRPLTAKRHKSLVPLCNRPFIGYLFDWLHTWGIERVVLAIGQHNEDLADAYPAGKHNGVELVLVREHERLESGGAIRNAVRIAGINERFVVLNGDVYVDFDFERAHAEHVRQGAELTLALYDMPDPSQFGVAVTDDDGIVTGFVEKPPPGEAPGTLVNAGVWIFEPGLVNEIPPGAVRVEETLFPSLVARRRRVLGYTFEGLWTDIGTWPRYLELNQALLPGGANAIGADAVVAQGAIVSGSAVGSGARIAAGATVDASVLWEGVEVGANAVVRESVIADGVVVGEGASVTGAVIGRGAVVAPGAVVPRGTSVDTGARYDAGHDH